MDSQPIIRDLILANIIPPSTETRIQLVESDKRPFVHTIVNTRNDSISDPHDLDNLAKQIETYDSFIRANVSNRVQVIVNQVDFLRQEAQRILMKGNRDAGLNHSACNHVRRSGQKYFSIMHLQDWMIGTKTNGCPHRFLGAYKLEYDNSWSRQATNFGDGLDE